MTDKAREEQLRIQAIGAAISRRDWQLASREGFVFIRYEFDRRQMMIPDEMCEPIQDRCGYCTLDNYPKRCPECPNRMTP